MTREFQLAKDQQDNKQQEVVEGAKLLHETKGARSNLWNRKQETSQHTRRPDHGAASLFDKAQALTSGGSGKTPRASGNGHRRDLFQQRQTQGQRKPREGQLLHDSQRRKVLSAINRLGKEIRSKHGNGRKTAGATVALRHQLEHQGQTQLQQLALPQPANPSAVPGTTATGRTQQVGQSYDWQRQLCMFAHQRLGHNFHHSSLGKEKGLRGEP